MMFPTSLLLLAPLVRSHMVMMTPKPYGNPTNSPVEADGSNFPCKATSNAGGPVTEMVIGASQILSFQGSAVHGGGSCQLSLTTDSPATRSSKWQVIHSILGGCPARQAAGNLGGGASAFNPDTYNYSIPAGVAPGTYTLAWTWFNRIGNRELYMNCASIKVKAANGKRDQDHSILPRDTFPDMFVANIPTSNCVTTEGKDVQFPNPGNSIERGGQPQDLAPPTGPRCLAGPAGVTGAAPSSNSGNGASPPVAAAPVASSPIAAPSSNSGNGASPPIAAAPVASSPVAAPLPSQPVAPAYSPVSLKPPSLSTPSVGTNTIPCAFAGQPVCSADKTMVGLCDINLRAVLKPVPQGTVCKNGYISWPQKRHLQRHQHKQ